MSTFEELFEVKTIERIRKQLKRADWGHKLTPVKGESKVETKTMTILDWHVESDKRGREQLVITYNMTDSFRSPKQEFQYRVQEEVLPYIFQAMEEGILCKNTDYYISVEMWTDGYKNPNRWLSVKTR